MTDFLEMKNLSKFYGNIIALTGVTTTVNPGEVTCVLGDNGAGKSHSSRSWPACTSTTRAICSSRAPR